MNSGFKKMLQFLLVVSPTVLLVVPDNVYFPFISGKGMLFRFLVEVVLAMYIFLIIKDVEFRPKKSALLASVLIFTGVIFCADFLSLNFAKAFWSNFERSEGFVLIMHLAVYVIILGSVLKGKMDWLKFWYSTVAVGIAMSLFALLQIKGGTVINQGATRIDALMGNSAYFAGFLLFQFFILLFLFKQDDFKSKFLEKSFVFGSILFSLVYLIGEKSTKQGGWIMTISLLASLLLLWISKVVKEQKVKILTVSLYVILLSSFAYLLFLTQTRGASLGLIGGLFISALIVSVFEKRKNFKITGFVFVGGIILLVGGFIAIRDTQFVKSSPVLHRFAEISWKNTSGQARQIIWPMAIEGFKEKPILGWGQEGFNYVFGKYYNPELWRHEPWFDRTHNVFLDWLVAGGLLGLLAYLSIYVFSVMTMVKVFFKDCKVEFAILIGLLSAYIFQNLFIFDNLGSYILFFSLVAFLHSRVSENKIIESKQTINSDEVHPALIALMCSAFLWFIVYTFSYTPYNQSRTLIQAMSQQKTVGDNLALFKEVFSIGYPGLLEAREQFLNVTNQVIVSPSIDNETKKSFLIESANQAKKQLEELPFDLKPLLSIASGFNQSGNPDIALEILGKIREYSPHKQHILMQIGISYLIKNDLNSAYTVLKEAYDESPEYVDVAMLLASVSVNKGDTDFAFKILEVFALSGQAPKTYVIQDLVNKGYKSKAIHFVETAYSVSPDPSIKATLESLKK